MHVTYINEKDAPPAPAKTTKGMDESAAILAQLGKGKVAAITPDDGQTMRGLKASMSRAANRQGTKITAWDVDGTLYIKLAS